VIASTVSDRAAFDAALAAGLPLFTLQPDDARARAQLAACRADGGNRADCEEMVRAGLVNGRSCPTGLNVVLRVDALGAKVRECGNTDANASGRKAAILVAEARARAGLDGPPWLALGAVAALGLGAWLLLR